MIYIYHAILGENSVEKVLNILSDGFIKLGSELDSKYYALSGDKPQKYIFANMYFPEIENISFLWGSCGIVLHSDLVYDRV